jgi:periplasmic binding family protein
MRTRLLAHALLASALPALAAATPAGRSSTHGAPAGRSPIPAVAAAPAGQGSASAAEDPAARRFVVIVHPANEIATISRKHLADLFLKKVTHWPDGTAVHPVEPPEASLARAYFLSDVMGGRSAFAMKTFWNRRVLSGREVPPIEKGSEDEVVAFVRATPGAVGYVLATTPPTGVRIVELTD